MESLRGIRSLRRSENQEEFCVFFVKTSSFLFIIGISCKHKAFRDSSSVFDGVGANFTDTRNLVLMDGYSMRSSLVVVVLFMAFTSRNNNSQGTQSSVLIGFPFCRIISSYCKDFIKSKRKKTDYYISNQSCLFNSISTHFLIYFRFYIKYCTQILCK